ncbi:hypothetical protein [Oerskovia enterophila]|uniref:Uncharacterized protein n=1 Tax=Oerskovia enterophila TaxID=43678 RepID=A0ABX2YFK8_9CELL|nr:hypothetical protein [Oerskovia enterophila]OCI32805.1 hypothetical protein OERS_03970 [Oerskovia enterophila]
MTTRIFSYSAPVEVTVRVDIDDADLAEAHADDLAREALSRLMVRDDAVTILAPVDLPPAYETRRDSPCSHEDCPHHVLDGDDDCGNHEA